MTDAHFLYSDLDLLSPKLSAKFLGGTNQPLALTTLALWRKNRVGPPFIRVGNSIRYPVSGLKSFIQSMTVNPIHKEVL